MQGVSCDRAWPLLCWAGEFTSRYRYHKIAHSLAGLETRGCKGRRGGVGVLTQTPRPCQDSYCQSFPPHYNAHQLPPPPKTRLPEPPASEEGAVCTVRSDLVYSSPLCKGLPVKCLPLTVCGCLCLFTCVCVRVYVCVRAWVSVCAHKPWGRAQTTVSWLCMPCTALKYVYAFEGRGRRQNTLTTRVKSQITEQ